MPGKRRLIIAIVLITIISWLDYQYFMEDNTAVKVTDNTRKIFHVLAFAGILVSGRWGWKPVSLQIANLWTAIYLIVLAFITGIGLSDRLLHFSDDFLNEISRLRMFFTSPMPFAALYVLHRLLNKRTG